MPQFDFDALVKDIQKPGRYAGGELGQVMKDRREVNLRFAFSFPDTYEVGMSYLGMKILYSLLNDIPDIWCERVFAPWPDMEQAMRRQGVPLFALESRDSLTEFDIIGFSLQYELSYTNVLNMLDLAGIPVFAKDRTTLKNLVIAGGPCVCNPEPLSDFIDLFLPGEGEEVLPELAALYLECKRQKTDKQTFLKQAAEIPGVYVPSLYEVSYQEDGRIDQMKPLCAEAKLPCAKRIIRDMDKAHYPKTFVLPYIEIVHDRAVEEIFRGCIRGCRFCQAGFIYRPVREKSSGVISGQAKALCESTGYDEVSLPFNQRLYRNAKAADRYAELVGKRGSQPFAAVAAHRQFPEGADGKGAEGAEILVDLRAGGGHPAYAGRDQQKHHRGRYSKQL